MSDHPSAAGGSPPGGTAGGGLGLPAPGAHPHPAARPYSASIADQRPTHQRSADQRLADQRLAARDGGGWPGRLDLGVLRQHERAAGPLGAGFDYAAAFATVDLQALAADLDAVLTTSQDWWPADFGHYGPLVVRMVWHCAGTYRIGDGRGGPSASLQRFAPVDSWPDNRNLDKARRLLWPVKQKYGRRISWADLLVFAGNRALESMGFTTFGYAGGRAEVFTPAEVYWGPEQTWLGDERHTGVRELQHPLAADQLGLIYVNPEGPNTVPDPVTSARDIRTTFRRMGMNDEETVALIAGGHTFGKTHGGADPERHLGREPAGAGLEEQGLGWANSHGTGAGPDTVTSGLHGTWTPTPTTWDNSFLDTLFGYEWDVALSPAGLWQWVPKDGAGAGTVPDPHDPAVRHAPTFLTTDLALRVDPGYEPIARRFHEHPDQLVDSFARAWFKLTHLDLGPRSRYLGPLVPAEPLLWQDPVPAPDHEPVAPADLAALKQRLLTCGLSIAQLVSTAWASASTYRYSDKRGGANGARLRLEPQRRWPVNDPAALAEVLVVLSGIQDSALGSGLRMSLADLIVLGGCAAVEQAATEAGFSIDVPFRPGRTDATAEWTDASSFAVLEPVADGFRNYRGPGARKPSEQLLVERADLLTLSAAETAVLVGGLRGLGVTAPGSRLGVLTARPGTLTNDFFVNLLDQSTVWTPVTASSTEGPDAAEVFEGRARSGGALRWTASRVDLVFGAQAELRAIAELYAGDDAGGLFVQDFVSAWAKVMDLDRFDVAPTGP